MSQRENHDVLNPAITILKSKGWATFHLSPVQYPGYPDIDAKKDIYQVLIEVKDLSGLSDKMAIKSQFTKYQIPWLILNYRKIKNIYLIIKIGSLFYYAQVSREIIEIVAYNRIIDIPFYFKQSDTLLGAVNAIIDRI